MLPAFSPTRPPRKSPRADMSDSAPVHDLSSIKTSTGRLPSIEVCDLEPWTPSSPITRRRRSSVTTSRSRSGSSTLIGGSLLSSPSPSSKVFRLPSAHDDPFEVEEPSLDRMFSPNKNDFYEPLGEEMSEYGKIWKIYSEETTEADGTMVDGWNRSLDVLLIFAGLFSAVLTAFTTESYKLLQKDPNIETNRLLSDISHSLNQLAGDRILTADIPQHSSSSQPSSFSAPRSAVWLNGLWFTSLASSLLVSVLAMLAKQWLHAYSADLPIYPHERSRVRQYRYDGASRWHLSTVISILPTLLHISLGLFMAGLVLFIWPLHFSIGVTMLTLASLVGALYGISTVLPLVHSDCPYRTPLTSEVGYALHSVASLYRRTREKCFRRWSSLAQTPPDEQDRISQTPELPEKIDFNAELEQVSLLAPELDARALGWLLRKSRNQPSIEVAAKAVAGLQKSYAKPRVILQAGALSIVRDKFVACFSDDGRLREDLASNVALYCRGIVQLLQVVESHEQRWAIEIRECVRRPLHTLSRHMNRDLATIAKCTWTAVRSASGSLSSADLIELLDCVYDTLDEPKKRFNLSFVTLSLLLGTLSTCFGRLAGEDREIVKLASVPLLVEFSPLFDSSDVLLRETFIKTLAHLVLDGDCNYDAPNDRAKRSNVFVRLLIRSLTAVLKSPIRLGVSQEIVELGAQQLFKIIDFQVIGNSQADVFDQSILTEVCESLISCLSTTSPSKSLLHLSIPVICAVREFVEADVLAKIDTEATLSTADFLAQILEENTVHALVNGGGLRFLCRHMHSDVPRIADMCVASVKHALTLMISSTSEQDWTAVESSGILTNLKKLITSNRFTYADLVSWSMPLYCLAYMDAEAAERSGVVLAIIQATDRFALLPSTGWGELGKQDEQNLARLRALVEEQMTVYRSELSIG